MEWGETLRACTGFEWDEGNATKSWQRHQVSQAECEELFFGIPFLVAPGAGHSQTEARHYGLGRTAAGRRLFVVFTICGEHVRVISARPMSRHERGVYERSQRRS